jgi:hypothetical protein
MEMLLKMVLRSADSATADEGMRFAECARCGRQNRLIEHVSRNGGRIFLQPSHHCTDGITEAAL